MVTVNAIVLEVQLNHTPNPLEIDLDSNSSYSEELWYPTVTEEGVISWEISTRKTPPAPVNIQGPQGEKGDTGNGIASVVQIGGDHSPGTFDTYRITFTNGTYTDYQVYNGEDGSAQTYVYEQSVAASSWTIQHNLGRYPAVTVVDTAGTEVVGDVQYINENQIILNFRVTFSGTAYLN